MSKVKVIRPKETLAASHKAALLLVSMSSLVLEFTMIRVMSVSLWYHFAFMIISIALLGFGISGVAILTSKRLGRVNLNTFLTNTAVLYSVSVPASFYLLNKIPFDPFSIFKESVQFFYLPVYYIIVMIPFFLSGLIIGMLFTKFRASINNLYFFDLVGAGLSCFIFILVLPEFGGPGGIIAASLAAGAASFLFSLNNERFRTAYSVGILIIFTANAFFLFDAERYFPISVTENKVYGNYLKENPHLRILSRWNTFSKIDVITDEDPPVDAYPVYTAIIDEGNSTTNIPKVLEITDSMPHPLDASNLAMILKRDTANVFVVGSGGGGEILTALTYNARSVTAVEINGILNDLIKKDFAKYWTAGLANDKRVRIITDDARSFLRGKRIKFDVIISAHTISASATSSGAMSLLENYIMTREAVRDYLQHLKVDGILYVSRPESQIPRLITTIKAAHKDIGGIDLKNQFYIFKRPPSEFEKDISFLTGVVYKKDGLNEFDIQLLKTHTALLSLETVYDPVSNQPGIYRDLIETDDIYTTAKSYQVKLDPATDDNPYFEHLTDFSDLSISSIVESFSQKERAVLSLVQKPVAESMLVVLFIQIFLLSALLIFIPLRIIKKKNPGIRNFRNTNYLLYFGLIGLGYIMIEICLIQKFTLFLGQPVYTMLTVISSMLVFSGIGSMLSDRVLKLFRKKAFFIYLSIALLTVLIGLLSPYFFALFIRAEIAWRVILSVSVIAPLAFLMGMPFPYGIKQIVNSEDESRYAVAYSWGVNGFFSVIGSVLVVIMSMSLGFRAVFIFSALVYLSAMLIVKKFKAEPHKV